MWHNVCSSKLNVCGNVIVLVHSGMVVTVWNSVSVDYKSTQIICKVSTIKGTSKLEDTRVCDITNNVMCRYV